MRSGYLRMKAEHVRTATADDSGHTCHARGCTAKVKPAFFMCVKHWKMLDQQLRTAIWQTYRPGQERDKTPSANYIAAAKAAIDYIARVEDVQGELL